MFPTTHLRIIGDSHGLHRDYVALTKDAEHTLHVGDVGFEYRYLRENLRAGRDHAIGGNHEFYEKDHAEYFMDQPFALKDFGNIYIPQFGSIFYVRGAWSIDKQIRLNAEYRGAPKTWFENEEVSYANLSEAVELYREIKPDFVITHEAPHDVVEHVTNPRFAMNFGFEPGTIKTRTNMALQSMFEIHQPKKWIFGHYHTRKVVDLEGTRFICLDMLGRTSDNRFAYIDFPAKDV